VKQIVLIVKPKKMSRNKLRLRRKKNRKGKAHHKRSQTKQWRNVNLSMIKIIYS